MSNSIAATYIFSLDLTGILERAVIRLVLATLISNEAFNSGSSKQGKTRRALLGAILVAANHLQYNNRKQLFRRSSNICFSREWLIAYTIKFKLN
jgi:hypothetical protein